MSKLYESLGFKSNETLAIVFVFSLIYQFLGAFTKLQKELLALSCLYTCLSSWNDSVPTGCIFMR